MRIIWVFIFGLIVLNLGAQGWRTKFSLPGNNHNSGLAIFEITPGNYLACGTSAGSTNVIDKLDLMGLGAHGELLWSKQYAYYTHAVSSRAFCKRDHALYYTCIVESASHQLAGALVKFDLNGNRIWEKTYSDAELDVAPKAMTSSIDGGFLLTGTIASPDTAFCLLLKTDASGNELWRKKIKKNTPPYAHYGNALVQDSTTGKIVLGGIMETNNYQGGYSSDIIMIFDSLGNLLTTHSFENSGTVADLIQTRDKNFIATGATCCSMLSQFDPLSKSYAVKFDLNAATIWEITDFGKNCTPLNVFQSAKELSSGDIILGGEEDTNLVTKGRITKISALGTVLWNRYYDYANNANLFVMMMQGLNLTSDNGFVAAFSKDYNGPYMFTKFDEFGCDSSLEYCEANYTVGYKNIYASNFEAAIYPNPANTSISFAMPDLNDRFISIEILDMYGSILKQITDLKTEKLDVSDLDTGVYLLKLTNTENAEVIIKLVIAR